MSLPDNPHCSPAVRARLRVADETALRNAALIEARFSAEKREEIGRRVNALVRSRGPIWVRLRGLYAVLDELNAYIGEQAACRKGCAHCCHIAVAILEPEAQMLGAKLQRKPKKVAAPGRRFDTFDFGYHRPCTFLKNSECSIYADRPFPCRAQVNLDVDALLCELTPPHMPSVPYLGRTELYTAYSMICQTRRLADIREYFPLHVEPT